MKDRLIKVLNHLGLTATRLADEIGVQRSGISHILSGRNQPGYDFMVKLLTRFPELSAEWLLLGKGTLLKDKDKSTADSNKHVNEPSIESVKQQDLFSTAQIRDEDPEVYLTKNTQVTIVTSIDKVLLLHHDGTFKVYRQPEKD
ncbi:MAG: helix-turn-helix transcriptional regulator [Bacteroidales bacterium]|nr:helix-turn-helix transcriptional regulator [Bacteroidales bacterium]